jgi:hypothetical protein
MQATIPGAQTFFGEDIGTIVNTVTSVVVSMLQPHEIAQIVSAVTPLVVSFIQSRSYQGHFGQFLPRAA